MADFLYQNVSFWPRRSRLANSTLLLMFFLVMLFPLFPVLMQGSHLHINLLLLVFAVYIFTIFRGVGLNVSYLYVILYFLLLQVCIVLGVLLSGNGFTVQEFLSLLRPFQHAIIFLSVFVLYSECRLSNISLAKVISVFVWLSFVYMFVELFFVEYGSSFVYGLYKREYRETLRFAYTSFFGTTYYSGFVYFCLYVVVLPFAVYYRKINYIIVVVMLMIMVLAAQSKLMLMVLIAYTFIYLFWVAKGAFRLLISLLVATLILMLMSNDILEKILADIPLTSASSLKRLLFDTQNSGTLSVRMEQIMFAFNKTSIFGVGSGRDFALESWLSSYLYRYGVTGAVAFVIFNSYLGYKSYSVSRRNKTQVGFKIVFYRSLCLWFLFVPITQMSSAMIDGSKFLYIYMLMISVVLLPDRLEIKEYER